MAKKRTKGLSQGRRLRNTEMAAGAKRAGLKGFGSGGGAGGGMEG